MPHVLADEYKNKCPIWNTPAKVFKRNGYIGVISPRVGVPLYSVDNHSVYNEMVELVVKDDNEHKKKLTTMIIDRHNESVTSYIIDEYIRQAKRKTALNVSQRSNRLLKYLVNESEKHLIGYLLHINSDSLQHEMIRQQLNNRLHDEKYEESVRRYYEALAWSESTTWQELCFLLNQLGYFNLLESIDYYGEGVSFRVTHNGYQKAQEIVVNTDSSQVFVAMWFGKNDEDKEKMNKLYDHIEQAAKNTGYTTLRIDRKKDLNKVDDEIIAQIRQSQFVIADFTHGNDGARGGVYYETGFAEGLGKTVIRSCREDQIKKIHFNTRQYYHIGWKTEAHEQLIHELEQRIVAHIGEGPLLGNNES